MIHGIISDIALFGMCEIEIINLIPPFFEHPGIFVLDPLLCKRNYKARIGCVKHPAFRIGCGLSAPCRSRNNDHVIQTGLVKIR